MKLLLIALLLACPASAFTKSNDKTVLNDAWYVMRAGKSPWGYFREVIEKRDKRYSYRYVMTKIEGGKAFQETIGALAELNLKPVAFNLVKAGSGATEIIDGTYGENATAAFLNVEISGAKSVRKKAYFSKDAILDVFFPVWVHLNIAKLKPGYKTFLKTVAEDPKLNDFVPKTVNLLVKGPDAAQKCLLLQVTLDTGNVDWCMTEKGALVYMKGDGFVVERAENEAQAKRSIGHQ